MADKYTFDEFNSKIYYNDKLVGGLFNLTLLTIILVMAPIFIILLDYFHQNLILQEWFHTLFLARNTVVFDVIYIFSLLALLSLILLFVLLVLHKLTKKTRLKKLYAAYIDYSDHVYFAPTILQAPVAKAYGAPTYAILYVGDKTQKDAEKNAKIINDRVEQMHKTERRTHERKASRLYFRESNRVISISKLFPELPFTNDFVFGYSSFLLVKQVLVCRFPNGKHRYYFWK